MKDLKGVFFAIVLLIFPLIAEPPSLRVIHQKGQISTIQPDDNFPQNSEIGFELSTPLKVFASDFSELVMQNTTVSELSTADLTNFEFLEDKDGKRILNLTRGYLLLDLKQENTLPRVIKVPYGEIEWLKGKAIIEVRQDNSALVLAEQSELEITHTRGYKKTLKTEESVILDRFGFKEANEKSKNKTRVIFDFSRDDKKEKEVMASRPTNKKSEEEKKQEKSSQKNSKTVKGKVAKDAKIVEGDGDGEGEYKWNLGPDILVVLLSILAILGIFFFLKYRKKNSTLEESETNNEKKEGDYEGEDVYVVRGNLTANDQKLITTKTTHILGNVEDGAQIEASHKLIIKGSFQGGQLTSTHNVNIEGGINGMSKANLQIMGDLKTTYISEAHVLCLGTVKAEQAIRNSKVAAEGLIKVEKKDIIGGTISSKNSIECEVLGSDFSETLIHLGTDALTVWKTILEQQVNLENANVSMNEEMNKKASIRIFDEVVSVKIQLDQVKLDQKKPLPGPIESHYEHSDGGKLVFRGFKRDD